jgi:DNA-binding Xre family transcriptional regulator
LYYSLHIASTKIQYGSLYGQIELITSGQIRAARALLRWSSADLSEQSGVGTATIKRMEVMDGVPSGQVRTLLAIKEALEAAGVEFIGAPDNAPGVRLRG